MSEKVERVLVQGTVEFRVSCNLLKALVTPEMASNPTRLKDWLEDKAFKMIDSADVEVEIDNDRTVYISEKLADKFTDKIVYDDDWKVISDDNKKNQ